MMNNNSREKISDKIRIEITMDTRPKSNAKSTIYKEFGTIPVGKIFYLKHTINNYPSYFIKVSDKTAIKINNCGSNVELQFVEGNPVYYTDYTVSSKKNYIPKNEEERKFLEQNKVEFKNLNNLDLFYYESDASNGLYVKV